MILDVITKTVNSIFIIYWKNHEWLSFYCFESRCSSNIHEMKTQKMCECQNANFNKNALVFFSSNYINWLFDYLFAKIVLLNTNDFLFFKFKTLHHDCRLRKILKISTIFKIVKNWLFSDVKNTFHEFHNYFINKFMCMIKSLIICNYVMFYRFMKLFFYNKHCVRWYSKKQRYYHVVIVLLCISWIVLE